MGLSYALRSPVAYCQPVFPVPTPARLGTPRPCHMILQSVAGRYLYYENIIADLTSSSVSIEA